MRENPLQYAEISAIANTISGLILAFIAGVAYFVKLKLDLRHDAKKQHQSIQIANEETRKSKRAAYDANIVRLKRDMHNMAAAMADATNQACIQRVWDEYRAWLRINDLPHLSGTLRILAQYSAYGDNWLNLSDANVPLFAGKLSASIMQTELHNWTDHGT